MDGHDAAREVAIAHALETGGAHQAGELLLRREPADAFDEIAIGVAVACHGVADPGHDLERVTLVELADERHRNAAELHAEKAPARPEDSMHLGERALAA